MIPYCICYKYTNQDVLPKNDSNEENPASQMAERRRVGFGASAFFMRRQKKALDVGF